MSRTHDLKCWPEPFEQMRTGFKAFEWRKDDRGYAVGDMLTLREWDPLDGEYTSRAISVEVTYILRGAFGMPGGYVVMSVRKRP